MITSIQNTKVKTARDLLRTKKHRDASRMMVIEGVRLAEEVLSAKIAVHLCLYSNHLSARGRTVIKRLKSNSQNIEEVSAELMERISDTKTSQGILMIVPYPQTTISKPANLILVLDQIKDPGNLGTILRTASAMEVKLVLLTTGTTDPYSPKALRSAMGAQFKIPIQWMNAGEIMHFCKQNGIKIFMADANCPHIIWNASLGEPICLVIGSEANGVSKELRSIADDCLYIPMVGNSDSFNAAISTGILLYEIQRQRKLS